MRDEKFSYYFVYLTLILLSQMVLGSTIESKYDIAICACESLLTLFGMIYVFRTNCKGDSKSFIERSICLSIPITVRSSIIIALPGTLVVLLIAIYNTEAQFLENLIISLDNLPTCIVTCVLSVVYNLYFYYRLNKCIKIVAALPKAETEFNT
ncbi:hypothetical protein NF27_DP01720 [Candidatus Jidaibacter acanthamoeba]|uniref:Uncharacterized protein n=1 Tax=Candidatus Jidaibacter acanthamoebae TaxID=86105 RepID=A0A0C1QNJ8_9RICK|nr:hypothetical protein [Candidatus Jidaibacter acanthamoeba]KIE05628.1 hypothetical protein NF27_DP01720 [Candidatus Jidaibacter acanthamoeba]